MALGKTAMAMALLWFAAPAEAADIADLDQCREQINALDRTGTPAITSAADAGAFKTMLVDVWLQCRDGKFETANAELGQARALLSKTSGE